MLSASFLRKSFTGLFAILLAASVFTACGEKDENTEKGSDNEKKEEKTEEQKDPGREDFIRGKAALETKDYKTAITHLMLAADKGNTDAMIELAECYESGRGVEKNRKISIEWYRKAAEKDNTKAQLVLVEFYAEGDGVEKNMELALQWCRRAAELDDPEAQKALAHYYGREKEDYEEALKWMRKAASSKSDSEYVAEAQVELAYAYEKGEIVKKDINEAIKWYRKAAGSSYARSGTAKEARDALKRLGAD